MCLNMECGSWRNSRVACILALKLEQLNFSCQRNGLDKTHQGINFMDLWIDYFELITFLGVS